MPQARGTHFVVTKTDGAIQSSADRISCSCSPSRFRNLNFFKVSKPEWQSTEGCVEERVPVAPCRQRCRRAFAHATIQPPEMKTQSPSGSRGRADVRISNLPPWLSLLCMVIYIKEEPAMQISMLALLGSRTGEARASVGTAPSNRHIQGMTRLDRCAGQDAEAGRPPIGMRVRMLQRDSSCRIRLLCGCRKTCWQHSYYPNDVRIPWDRFA